MSMHGESIDTSHKPSKEVRVALVIPETKSILVSPEYNSGLFVGHLEEDQSVEKAARATLSRHIGRHAIALKPERGLPAHEDEGQITYGFALKPSYRMRFNPKEFDLTIHRLDDYTPIDEIDQHFVDNLF